MKDRQEVDLLLASSSSSHVPLICLLILQHKKAILICLILSGFFSSSQWSKWAEERPSPSPKTNWKVRMLHSRLANDFFLMYKWDIFIEHVFLANVTPPLIACRRLVSMSQLHNELE